MATVADTTADYTRLRDDVGVVPLHRDVVRVAGPDAATFLQGQLSQDVVAVPMGGSADSFVLSPQGKVDAFVRVIRAAEDEFVVDVDAGYGDALVARLTRFKLRTKADVDPLDWSVLAVRGPRSADVRDAVTVGDETMVADVTWPGLSGFDLVGPAVAPPAGVVECGPEAYEALRIEAGLPVMGAELTESTIPAEAGVVDRAVSFTKGCFTGQELVARIDSRGGNVPRRLCGVLVDGDDIPPVGAAVDVGGAAAGALTSVAFSPGFARPVALAYIRRAVTTRAEAVIPWAGGSATATVVELPMTP